MIRASLRYFSFLVILSSIGLQLLAHDAKYGSDSSTQVQTKPQSCATHLTATANFFNDRISFSGTTSWAVGLIENTQNDLEDEIFSLKRKSNENRLVVCSPANYSLHSIIYSGLLGSNVKLGTSRVRQPEYAVLRI